MLLVIGIIFEVCCVLGLVILAVTQKRNRLVCDERLRAIQVLGDMGTKDIMRGRDPSWRLETYKKGPSYSAMVWKIWRPIGSFYLNDEGMRRAMSPEGRD